jgi:hypothetical protein
LVKYIISRVLESGRAYYSNDFSRRHSICRKSIFLILILEGIKFIKSFDIELEKMEDIVEKSVLIVETVMVEPEP